jgi:Holliday junction resolvase RusA-like endonuclease
LIIYLKEFPTHIQLSKNKFHKISGNSIYSGIHYILRNKIFIGMHDFILSHIQDGVHFTSPVKITLEFIVPINYGNVRFLKKLNRISWKPAPDDYKATWDIDNLAWPWLKAILDVLVKKMVIEGDTVEYVQQIEYKLTLCDTLEARQIIININNINNVVD